MKNVITRRTKTVFGFLVFAMWTLNIAYGQTPDPPVQLKAKYMSPWLDSNPNPEVRLRWYVNDYEVWKKAMTNGYTISRMTIKEDTLRLSIAERIQSRVVLDSTFLPRPNGNWDIHGNSDLSNAGRVLLYESNPDVSGNVSFADAVQSSNQRDNILFFASIVADQNFPLSTDMALGYRTTDLEVGNEYLYTISVNRNNTSEEVISSSVNVSTQVEDDSEGIVDFFAEGKPNSITIGWNIKESSQYYNAYAIERSLDGQQFQVVNEKPFLYISDPNMESDYAYYSDSIGQPGVKYFYRIKGMNPFGFYGPSSEIIEATTLKERMNIQLVIDSAKTENGKIFLGWELLDATYSDSLGGFEIYASERALGPFEKISSSPIAPSKRHFLVSNPARAMYYSLSSKDAYGNEYKSPPKLVQFEDSDPPRKPRGLSGYASAGDKISLSWEANTESDFQGYRLFRCVSPNGIFASVHFDILKETSFEDDLSGLVLADSVYYRIDAMDQNNNSSGFSKILAIKRYDVTPPTAPVLYKAQPLPMGVAIAWRYSSSEDVVLHELQRKEVGGPGWETIVSVENYQRDQFEFEDTTQITATCYVDSETLERRSYEYQFIAYDATGNVSGSDIITVRPYDSGSRGNITSFDLDHQCELDSFPSDLNNQLTNQINNAIISFGNNGRIGNNLMNRIKNNLVSQGFITQAERENIWDNYSFQEFYDAILLILELHGDRLEPVACTVELNWDYRIDPTVLNFQIMRSRAGSALRIYRTLPIEFFYPEGNVMNGEQSFSYVDDEVDPKVRYVYKILAQHSDGGYSDLTAPLTITPE